MNIKKFFVLIMISLLFFSLTACGNSTEKSKNQTSNKSELPAIPKQVFSSSKINENISKKEIKKSVSKYLDTNHALIENIKSLSNKLENEKLSNLEFADENDSNIYLQSNEIVIPIPNALVDDNDPIVSVVEDEQVRNEAKQFVKFAGKLNRSDIPIVVKLEQKKQETKLGMTTMIDIVFQVEPTFDYNDFKVFVNGILE